MNNLEFDSEEMAAEIHPIEYFQFTPVTIFKAGTIETTGEKLAESILVEYQSLDGYVILRRWREVFETAEAIVKWKAAGLVEKSVPVIVNGTTVATVTEKKANAKYEYNDQTRTSMIAEIERLKDELKAREKMLQTLTVEVADTVTGEMMHPARRTNPEEKTLMVKWEENRK